MVRKISVDDLVGGPAEAVIELDIKGRVFPIYPLNRMSEEITLRVLEANAQFEAANEDYLWKVQQLDDEIEKLSTELKKAKTFEKSALEAKMAHLSSRRNILQAKMVIPARVLIESMAGMPSGTLSQYPPQAINKLFEQVVEVVFPKLKETIEELPPQNINKDSMTDLKSLSNPSPSLPDTDTKGKKL